MKRKQFFIAGVFSIITFFGAATSASPVDAVDKVLIEMFERQDCGHCQAERAFLEQLVRDKMDIELSFIDIDTPEGKALFAEFTEKLNVSKATPITVVGAHVLQGFDSAETTGQQIESLAETNRGSPVIGIAGILAGIEPIFNATGGAVCDSESGICTVPSSAPLFVTLPFTDITIDAMQYSLPVLASILGFIDGFNPCAMWVLVTFLIVLVQMGSIRRMWAVAGLFIFAEAVMYYLILNVWFTTWDFIGLDRIVTPIVGALAVGGGLFFLYEWYRSDGTCQVTDMEGRAKISGRIKSLANAPFTWLTVAGIIGLAFSVNVIEFACSIGIPQAFTKIIELNGLGWLQSQGLMLLYILFYMVDDFLVFGLALWGFEKLHMTQTYSRWSNLIGGILMLILGFLLIFSPSTLRLM